MTSTHAPVWRHLTDHHLRAQLTSIRDGVTPILANNILKHFTDHSVQHSDSVADHVASLIDVLQTSIRRLSQLELFVLYASCYLHDVGMHVENPAASATLVSLGVAQRWTDLADNVREELLRQHHPALSAELVSASINSAEPPIGYQFREEQRPDVIACLCELHGVTPGSERYSVLLGDDPSIRTDLLAALLRLADILDESSYRALPHKAESLLLNLESQCHWWRHYYTRSVLIRADIGELRLVFHFPKGKDDEYGQIVPQLQVPWIEEELGRQRAVFAGVGCPWNLTHQHSSPPYSSIREMPDTVLTEMLMQQQSRRVREQEQTRATALLGVREGRPLVERRLASLLENRETLPIDEYVQQLAHLSRDLWSIGAHRGAWASLTYTFQREMGRLEPESALRIGIQLLTMLIDDAAPEVARGWINEFAQIALSAKASRLGQDALIAAARLYAEICGYPESIELASEVLSNSQSEDLKDEARSIAIEMHLLQGELELAVQLGNRC